MTGVSKGGGRGETGAGSLSAAESVSRETALDPDILDDVRNHAALLDRGRETSFRALAPLGAGGVHALGAPANADGRLPRMARVVSELAGVCMSTAFSVWAHRMVVEYLLASSTVHAASAVESLLTGERAGVTGMASAFRHAAGCGQLDLVAASTETGFELSGSLRWASNLHPESLLVTAARTSAGDRLIVVLPMSTPGVRLGQPFELLAMTSTSSSSVSLEGVRITHEQVLSAQFDTFLAAVRPTFLVLQSAMCLGLARTGIQQAFLGLSGVNAVFTEQVERAVRDLDEADQRLTALASTVGSPSPPTTRDLLSLRLAAAELAGTCTALEIRTAGGRGYASGTAANRRFREATFLPVQSPSEAQLRWELSRCGD